MTTIKVNGKERELASPTPLPRFLADNDIDVRLIAVAHNGVVLRRDEHPDAILKPGDTLRSCIS
jgi:thiamine biosynthesis protein ThiS